MCLKFHRNGIINGGGEGLANDEDDARCCTTTVAHYLSSGELIKTEQSNVSCESKCDYTPIQTQLMVTSVTIILHIFRMTIISYCAET